MKFKRYIVAGFTAFAMICSGFAALPTGTVPEILVNAEESDNSSQKNATKLTLNETYTDSLIDTSDLNWYKFTTETDGYFSMDFGRDFLDSTTTYWQMTIYKFEDGNSEINSWSFDGSRTNTSISEIGIPAGEYYIKITCGNYGYFNAVCTTTPYDLTINFTSTNDWETEFNNSMQTANEIKLNETKNASIHNTSDTDWYKFTTETDGYFTIDFGRNFLDTTTVYWNMIVYKGDDKITEINTWSYNGNQTSSSTNKIGVPAGDYYIEITCGNYGYFNAVCTTTPYALTVNFTSTNDWETEFNDSMQTANEIKLNETKNASIHNTNDTDWYKFTTETDGYFSVDFGRDFLDSTTTYWQMTVYKFEEGNNKINSWSFDGSKTNTSINEIGIPAGEYYIEITCGNYGYFNAVCTTTPYSLTVNFTSANDWETEFNNSMQTANELSLNETKNASIHNTNDTDWYKFTAETDGYFSVDFGRDFLDTTTVYWNMILYKIDGEISEINTWNFNGSQVNSSTNEIEITAGEYYIEITCGNYGYFNAVCNSTPYSLKVNFVSATSTTPDVIMGDVNLDGEFNVMDVVILQKWILGVKDVKLECWQNADFNKDEVIDIFDLCLMKRALIEQ